MLLKIESLPIFDNFRQEKGGVLLITTRLLNHLQGSWPPPRYTLLLYQWNTVASLNEYEERIQSNGKAFGTEIIKLFTCSTHIIKTSLRSNHLSMNFVFLINYQKAKCMSQF